MAEDDENVRANNDSDSGSLPEDPGGVVAKGPSDNVRANQDDGDSGEDE